MTLRKVENSTASMLMTPEEKLKMMFQEGVVVAKGDQVTYLETGDRVLYSQASSYTVTINEELILVVPNPEQGIICILEEGETFM